MQMHEQLKSLLREAGLSDAEIIIYIELLKNPSQTKWDLISRTGLEKNRLYRAFDHLNELKMVAESKNSIEAHSLDYFISTIENSQKKLQKLIEKIKKFSPFLKVPNEAVSNFEVITDKEKILEKYILMSEVPYETCLDFGDLENFVPVLGGLKPVFKFRENRFNKCAKNRAICTTLGPYTSCMARTDDMKKFKSSIELLKIDFKNRWIIFSDTDDRVMFNYFSDKKNPCTVLVNSKVIADTQREMFNQFYNNISKFN